MSLSFSPINTHPNESLPPLVLVKLSNWSLLSCEGDDKKSYLQGQITCDVVTLEQNNATLGAYCDAKGKMISLFHLFHYEDGYGLFLPESIADNTLAELKKYAMFSKITLEKAHNTLFGIMGETANAWIDNNSDSEGDVRQLAFGYAIKIAENRWLVVSEEAQIETAFTDKSDVIFATDEIWTKANILSAMPNLSPETQNTFIPQAVNLQALNGISFKKGCYRGQETVARAKYRGINKRALCLISGKRVGKMNNGDVIQRAIEDQWRTGGTILSSYQCADNNAIALVVLPNDLSPETSLRFADEPENVWKIEPLPYSLDEE
jgi:hypothetical protein